MTLPVGEAPHWWREASGALAASDATMGRVIAEWTGHGHLRSRGDPFTTLARSIVGQQISVKAAQSVWN
ncbi:MAG: DNA-3-methyladenine glycosylase 2 family protein, partial [Burkholderiales bacterium]